MESNQQRRVAQVLWRAAVRPMNLLLLLLSTFLLLDPRARAYGALGLLLYVAAVYAGTAWQAARAPRQERAAAAEGAGQEDAAAPLEPCYQQSVRVAEAARRRLRAAVESAGEARARVLTPIATQADQVVAHLEGLVTRAQQLRVFLGRGNREHWVQELAALDERIAACTDEFTREQYRQARRAREEQLRSFDDLALCLGRVEAQITNVLSSLEAAEAKVMRLQAADLHPPGPVADTVTRSLQELSLEMTGFQESIDATIAIRMRQ